MSNPPADIKCGMQSSSLLGEYIKESTEIQRRVQSQVRRYKLFGLIKMGRSECQNRGFEKNVSGVLRVGEG